MVLVINVGDEKGVLGPLIRLAQLNRPQQGTSWISLLDKEAIVADEPEDFAVAIDAVITEHLTRGNHPRSSTLVGYIWHEILLTGPINSL